MDTQDFDTNHAGYQWLVDRQLVGFEPFTQLQPWYFTKEEDSFCASEEWPGVCEEELYVFARRQDNDDLACFAVKDEKITGVYVIEGWFGDSFLILAKLDNIWEWLKWVLDDIEDLLSVVHERYQDMKE